MASAIAVIAIFCLTVWGLWKLFGNKLVNSIVEMLSEDDPTIEAEAMLKQLVQFREKLDDIKDVEGEIYEEERERLQHMIFTLERRIKELVE